jgi:hypothetical protein
MALRGTLTHRKTRRLAQALGIPPCFALGLLEALWNVTAEQAPDGAIGSMSDEDIAMEMFYDGDARKMIEAMVTAELLDRDSRVRLIVHDWHLHSDDTTDAKLGRARRRYANGEIPRLRKLSKDDRERILADFDAEPKSRRTTAHNGALPEPEPVPVPETNTPQPPAQAQGACGVESDPSAKLGTVVPIAQGRTVQASDDGGLRRRGAPPGVESAIWRAAVDSVCIACDSGDRKLRRAVERAMHVATAKSRERGDPQWPDEIAGRMVAARKEFVWNLESMRYALGPVNFFSQGIWVDETLWPWDPQRLREARRASVGL